MEWKGLAGGPEVWIVLSGRGGRGVPAVSGGSRAAPGGGGRGSCSPRCPPFPRVTSDSDKHPSVTGGRGNTWKRAPPSAALSRRDVISGRHVIWREMSVTRLSLYSGRP